ncbi:RNA-binding protein [Candidatus Pacearchaeota archaeon CG10_big_fil_rev_8_21_14_0_10_32_42]|nr:MAG: RNA-binding protein [Candidatus Pacearchaeota archaeon CG10_big_fil_rev_8_21_14_0_10_32_42]
MDKVITTFEPTGNRIKEYLKAGKRFDDRELLDFRKISIERDVSNKAEGSVRVKLGQTEVIVGVKLGVSAPYPDSLNKGNLMVTAEMLPLSSPRFEPGPPRFEAIELGRVTDRGLRESGFIDLEKLCIKEGEKVWTIFVDIYSINDDGNLMDAATIGSIVALKIAKMPKYDEENGKILYEEKGENLPLTNNIPVAVSVHKIGDSFVVDPTREEEDLSECRVTIANHNGTISSLQKSQSKELEIEEMKKIFEISEEVSKKILKEIEKA